MLAGAEISTDYRPGPEGAPMVRGAATRLEPGDVESLSPAPGACHQVRNAHADRVSISVHVYGANIGRVRRHVFDAETSRPSAFVSGYSSQVIPNIWSY